jgi:hypothetical protein
VGVSGEEPRILEGGEESGYTPREKEVEYPFDAPHAVWRRFDVSGTHSPALPALSCPDIVEIELVACNNDQQRLGNARRSFDATNPVRNGLVGTFCLGLQAEVEEVSRDR